MIMNEQINNAGNERIDRTVSTKDSDELIKDAYANGISDEDERILREKSEVKSPAFDTTPCLHGTIDDLDLNLFKTEYLPKYEDANTLESDRRDIKQQLTSLKLFDLMHDCPTVAGILLIGKNPKHFFFGAYIQYVKFAGTNRTSKVLKERLFSGNIITLLKELEYFIKDSIQEECPVLMPVLWEDEIRMNYPYEALRELAMNLIMHRNYQTNAPAKFYEYVDRIEMDNPGGLYGKVSPDNFPNENDYRNPIIADAMKAFGYVNLFCRGISMVQEELVKNKSGLAVFNFNDVTTFKVVVRNADVQAVKKVANESGLTERQFQIIALVQVNKTLTREALAKQLGVGRSTIFRDIDALKKLNIIERIGPDKSGYWKVKRDV